MIKEVKKEAPPPKKRPNIFVRFIAFLLTLALILGAIYLVVNRGKVNFDALKRWFAYRSLARSDSGSAEPFAYQGGSSLSLQTCGGDLLAVSESGVRLYSPGGTAYVEDTLPMKHPVCQTNGKAAVVYDAAGSTLRVYKDRAQVFDLNNPDATILSARLNAGGYLAVVTRSSGYKGAVLVYNADYKPLMTLNLSSVYILDAVVAPDNRSLLVVTADQENRFFNSTLAQYSLTDRDENPVPKATWSLGDRLPLDLIWDEHGVRVVTQYGALTADSALSQSGESDWSDRYLKRYSLLADDSIVVLTSPYRSGSQTTLEVLGRNGEAAAALEETRPISSISAAGKYIGVLTSQELNIYTRDLELYATVENEADATYLVMQTDGSAFLATQDTAWLYLPD